jgi:hypothetical protein
MILKCMDSLTDHSFHSVVVVNIFLRVLGYLHHLVLWKLPFQQLILRQEQILLL